MKRKIKAADLFCGAGGTSQGLLMAANKIDADLELLAINHWQVAVDTHSLNHPESTSLCTGVDVVDPQKLVPGGRLDVLCASPECTHHSVARAGKPMNDQSRASAWHILRWAQVLYIDNLIIENVPEFQSWGPLGVNGRPMRSKRGALFQQFIQSLKALGYRVEYRVLNCADYGDPTTRRRLFMIARRGNKPIRWPEPTRMPASQLAKAGLFQETRKPWRSAREIIDWSIPSKSIFERKRPLADKTLLRIQAGLKKFCGMDVDLKKCFREDLRPSLVVFRNNQDAQSIDDPVPTLTTMGANVGLVQPFIMATDQTGRDRSAARSVDSSSDLSLVEPFIVPQFGVADPRSIDRLLGTPTTTSRGVGLAQPFLVTVNHGGERTRGAKSVDQPMGTVTGKMGEGVCEPFLIAYYGTQNMSEAADPLPTVTSRDRFGLVEAEVTHYQIDIRFRMLQPQELARAQGFPDGYVFTGNREAVVKQIGNAVPPNTAMALIGEVLA